MRSLILSLVMLIGATANAAYIQPPYPILFGGTGATTAQQAIDNLATVGAAGTVLRSNGTDDVMAFLVSGDIPNNAANISGTAANITASSNSTLTTLSALSLPGSQVTGNISGNAANITATTNSTLTTLSSLALPYSQLSGTVPTWNQNTTGTAANITASSNSTITTLSALSLPYSQITGAPAALIFNDSIVNTAGTVNLVGDTASPTATQYYGTNGSSTRGWYNLPTSTCTVANGGDAPYTILAGGCEVRSGTTLTADRAYTLPACSANIGETHRVKNLPAQTFNLILTAAGSDLIDGNATLTIMPGDSYTVICGASGTWDIN